MLMHRAVLMSGTRLCATPAMNMRHECALCGMMQSVLSSFLLKGNLDGGQAGCLVSAKAHSSQQVAEHLVVHVCLRLHVARQPSHCSCPSSCNGPAGAAALLCKMCIFWCQEYIERDTR